MLARVAGPTPLPGEELADAGEELAGGEEEEEGARGVLAEALGTRPAPPPSICVR